MMNGSEAYPAPIVALSALEEQARARSAADASAGLAGTPAGAPNELERARAFAEPLLAGRQLDTGESTQSHADGVAAILAGLGAGEVLQAAAYLVYAADWIQKPDDVITRAFGPAQGTLVGHTRKLVQIQRAAMKAQVRDDDRALQTERVRKMLLAFSRDLRVVLLRLASRLQSLRWHAQARVECPAALSRETLEVFAPLANRLGIGQIKWELEDLAFRFSDPSAYREIARLLDERRIEREAGVRAFVDQLRQGLAAQGLSVEVQGRPKHLYSIWRKMNAKRLDFSRVMDLRAVRVIVDDVAQCYAVLARVHEAYPPVDGEFDDYIAKPKPNGYQSLHTVVRDEQGRAVEIQIRTRAMHEHAEFGVAAHWAYKEAGGAGRSSAGGGGPGLEERVAQARKAVLRQLLDWERETVDAQAPGFEDRLFVFTPQSAVVDLPHGGTPVDFAYALHTDLGHRCRGARVDGAMVPLNTPLRTGQTIEIVSVREGGPSLDWLNPDLGYLASPRSRAKVRAWFNAQEQALTVARGREAVERLLQREGRTALKLDDLAVQLGFRNAIQLFEVVGKDEYSLRNIETALRPAEPVKADDEGLVLKRARSSGTVGGILVVGVDSLLTHLARCCRPAPPDDIAGFVTRGRGVAIHRAACQSLRTMARDKPERLIAVAWGDGADAVYPLDIQIEAADRPALLRDVGEVFAREKINVTGVKTQSLRDRHGASAHMTFTVEVTGTARLPSVLQSLAQVPGVRTARRRQ